MTEILNELSIIDDAVEEDDCVVYLLASLPDSYNTLVTALEANVDVPKMEVLTEHLLHKEQKLKECSASTNSSSSVEAMFAKQKATKRGPKCHFYKRYGHIQRNCIEHAQAEKKSDPVEKRNFKHKANKAEVIPSEVSSSDDEIIGLYACHALSVSRASYLSHVCR